MNSEKTLAVVRAMEDALGRGDSNMEDYFHGDFVWEGNRGCGVKKGLQAFRLGWQMPFRNSFTERSYHSETWLADGEWAACYGHCAATHGGEFMGIAATRKRLRIPYIDFWQVRDGLIIYNKVSVDFGEVLHQLGHDIFNGHGWESQGK